MVPGDAARSSEWKMRMDYEPWINVSAEGHVEWRRGREDPDGQLWKVQSHREKAGKTGEQKSAGVVCGFKSCKIDQVKDSLKKKKFI